MKIPVFIICRDRYTCLINLIEWIEEIGHGDEIYLMDSDSTYPPLVDYLKTTKHNVLLHPGENVGHTAGWKKHYFKTYANGRPFILTDPDLYPVEECPTDVVDVMLEIINTVPFNKCRKVGMSLKIDDIPDHFNLKNEVIHHEKQFWTRWDEKVNAWQHSVDTTFALYSPHAIDYHSIDPAYRLPTPYTMRHLPWYVDTSNISEEEEYYRSRAHSTITNWCK